MSIDQRVAAAFPELSEEDSEAVATRIATLLDQQHVRETLPTLPLQVLFDRTPIPPMSFMGLGVYSQTEYEFGGYTFHKICGGEFRQEVQALRVECRRDGRTFVVTAVPPEFASTYEGTVGDWLAELDALVEQHVCA